MAQTHAGQTARYQSHKRKGKKAPRHPHVGRLKSKAIQDRIKKAAEGYPLSKKRHGGMTHVGLSPAEMSRSGTMSEAKRARYMRGGGPIHTTFRKKAVPHTEGRKTAVDLFPEVGRFGGGAALPDKSFLSTLKALASPKKRPKKKSVKKAQKKLSLPATKKAATEDMVWTKKGGKVGKKKQGYKARKDESIAMRVKKKRTKKQLTASRRESYGKWGTGKGKGKINRISSKQTDGNKVIAAIYG